MKTQYSDEALVESLPGFTNGFATVNGVDLHYVAGGVGAPLLLVPGWPETWWAYHKVMPLLSLHYRVIVVEMRGMGSSAKPEAGYDKRTMAHDLHALIQHLGYTTVSVCGHDIGAHVAFSFAANYPDATEKLILLDTPHPDAGMYSLPMLPIPGAAYTYPWWLAFNQVKVLPEQLLEGRMAIIIDWVFQALLTDPNAVTDFDRAVYAGAYNTRDAIRASNGWYQAFPQDIEDHKTYGRLVMPVLGIGGSGYPLLQHALPTACHNVEVQRLEACGHFILAEKPKEVAERMLKFLAG